jgi:hypothetical protein
VPAEPFDAVKTKVDAVVKKVFPKATRGEIMPGAPGWIVKRPAGAPRFEREGTMPLDRISIAIADRKAGPTLYLWYPAPDGMTDETRAALTAAGFKVMVGCLVFTKKQPYPIGALEALLRRLKALDAT